MQVCPRFNLLLICDFMAQLQNIAFDKISLVILHGVTFSQTAQEFWMHSKDHNLVGQSNFHLANKPLSHC